MMIKNSVVEWTVSFHILSCLASNMCLMRDFISHLIESVNSNIDQRIYLSRSLSAALFIYLIFGFRQTDSLCLGNVNRRKSHFSAWYDVAADR